MFILVINIIIKIIIILALLLLYVVSYNLDRKYIEEFIKSNEKLQIRVSGFSYTKNLIDSSCLISVKLKDKNLIYNKTIFKRLFNLGPDYLLVDSFQRNLEIYKALNSLLIDYDFNFEKEVIKV